MNRMPKPKLTPTAVQGKIIVTDEEGARVGQWGGTECFLSRQTGLGPCFVVRSSRHRRHEGTFFQLEGLKKVLSSYVMNGKLTLVIKQKQKLCTVFIETVDDIDELKLMSALLQDKSRFSYIEKNVASRKRATDKSQTGGYRNLSAPLRNPDEAALENDDIESDYDDYDIPSKPSTAAERVESSHSNLEAKHISAGYTEDPLQSYAATRSGPSFPNETNWSKEQQIAFEYVRSKANIFVTGAAGTGKTAWLLHLIENQLPHGPETAVTASTGISARLLGGSTIYSFAGIGRGEGSTDSVIQRVKRRADVLRAWQNLSFLIIDEIGMIPAHIFSLLDSVAREVRGDRTKPFGGIQLVLVGDFLQLPPVSREGEDVQFAFQSASWAQCGLRSIEFKQNFRHAEDALFAACCQDVRFGMYTESVEKVLKECNGRPLNDRYGVAAAEIMPRRKDVDAFNRLKLQNLGVVQFYRYESEDYSAYPGADIDSEISLPALLDLKVGAQVVLLARLPDYSDLVNGDLGVVVDFAEQTVGPHMPIVRFSTGVEAIVSRVRLEVFDREGSLSMARTQVPLQLAWALTVHRVQGMTLPMARVRLDRSYFESGQVYVALSRVQRSVDLSLEHVNPEAITEASPICIKWYEKTFGLTLRDESKIIKKNQLAFSDKKTQKRSRGTDDESYLFQKNTRAPSYLESGGDSYRASAPFLPIAMESFEITDESPSKAFDSSPASGHRMPDAASAESEVPHHSQQQTDKNRPLLESSSSTHLTQTKTELVSPPKATNTRWNGLSTKMLFLDD